MQYMILLQLLILLTVANGSPVAAKKIVGDSFTYPPDGGVSFLDGNPLFSSSKILRNPLVIYESPRQTFGERCRWMAC